MLFASKGINQKTNNPLRRANRQNGEARFDVKAFLAEGGTRGHVFHAMDGKPFLVKYGEPLIKEGKLSSLVIWLVDPNINENNIMRPSYFSETFSHFFGNTKDTSENQLSSNDGKLIIAEISLKKDESELLHIIDDLNYKHISEFVLNEYYASHKGRYDYIGRSMVGIAGRVLREIYGIRFLGIRTDKTKGFYWEISGHPPTKPVIPVIIGQLERVKNINVRRTIRENIYINIINNIIRRHFDPYMNIVGDIIIENAWECHCSKVLRILSDNKLSLGQLLNNSNSRMTTGSVEEFIDQIMTDYKMINSEWFNSISIRMNRLAKATQSMDKELRDRIIDEIISAEDDPAVRMGWAI
jgi:hypothetical protein